MTQEVTSLICDFENYEIDNRRRGLSCGSSEEPLYFAFALALAFSF
jgi:hypothetical protein